MKNVKAFQDLFNNNIFKVPYYQRGYSWDEEQVTDLIDDIELINNKDHYIGTVNVKEVGNVKGLAKKFTKYEIVDGQQRLTTLIIFLDLIAKELSLIGTDEAKKLSKNITENYIKEKDPDYNTIYKLELEDNNDTYFKEGILNEKIIDQRIKSHKLLLNAKTQIYSFLIINKSNNYLKFLCQLTEKITQKLVFTFQENETDLETGKIFEGMNDRGIPLSELEKLKNYFISVTERISDEKDTLNSNKKKINHYWYEILQNLYQIEISDNKFLQMNYILHFYSDLHVIIKNEKKINKSRQIKDTYKQLKKYFTQIEKTGNKKKCHNEIENYIISLKDTSARLRDILNPYGYYAFQGIDIKYKSQIQEVYAQINRLEKKSNILVLLISIYDKFIRKPKKLLELTKLCESLLFNVYYIVGKKSNFAENKINTLSCKIYRKDILPKYKINYHEILSNFENIILDAYNKKDISEYLNDSKDYYHWDGLKYLLYEYEKEKCKNEIQTEPELTWEHLKNQENNKSIEHILPQNIGKPYGEDFEYWNKRFPKSNHQKNCIRLGNLTLTIPKENLKLSNISFDNKKKIYAQSKWHINKELCNYEEWTEKNIRKRESDIIEYSKRHWNYKIRNHWLWRKKEVNLKDHGCNVDCGPDVKPGDLCLIFNDNGESGIYELAWIKNEPKEKYPIVTQDGISEHKYSCKYENLQTFYTDELYEEMKNNQKLNEWLSSNNNLQEMHLSVDKLTWKLFSKIIKKQNDYLYYRWFRENINLI